MKIHIIKNDEITGSINVNDIKIETPIEEYGNSIELPMEFSGSLTINLNYQNLRSMLRKLRNHKHEMLRKRQYSMIRRRNDIK